LRNRATTVTARLAAADVHQAFLVERQELRGCRFLLGLFLHVPSPFEVGVASFSARI
jgi:hypothetical protein